MEVFGVGTFLRRCESQFASLFFEPMSNTQLHEHTSHRVYGWCDCWRSTHQKKMGAVIVRHAGGKVGRQESRMIAYFFKNIVYSLIPSRQVEEVRTQIKRRFAQSAPGMLLVDMSADRKAAAVFHLHGNTSRWTFAILSFCLFLTILLTFICSSVFVRYGNLHNCPKNNFTYLRCTEGLFGIETRRTILLTSRWSIWFWHLHRLHKKNNFTYLHMVRCRWLVCCGYMKNNFTYLQMVCSV